MQIVTSNHAVKNFDAMVTQTLEYHEPVNIATDRGNLIVLSEEMYNNLHLTAEVHENPSFKKTLLEGHSTPVGDLIPESEVVW